MKTILYNGSQLYVPTKDIVRFYSKINIDYESGCWLWQCQKKDNGYGRFKFKRKYYAAHRFNYALTYGEIPEKLFGCHLCDHPNCVNPYHLWMGTHKENMQDMKNKNRNAIFLGEKNGRSKLTKDMVDQIRIDRINKMTYTEIGKKFNISKKQASRICKRVNWK